MAGAVVGGRVVFADSYGRHAADSMPEALKAVEVDEALLAHVEAGGVLQLKAAGDDTVVAVTEAASYSVTLVESSNAMFVACTRAGAAAAAAGAAEPPLAYEFVGRVGGYLELRRIAPPLARLYELLDAAPWRGVGELAPPGSGGGGGGDDDDDGGATQAVEESAPVGVAWRALVDAVQCSEGELRVGLRAAGALEYAPGWWTALAPAYRVAVLEALVRKAAAYGAPLSALPLDDLVTDLARPSMPAAVLRHVAASVSAAAPPPSAGMSDTGTVAVSFAALAAEVGSHLLHRLAATTRTAAVAAAAAAAGAAAPAPVAPAPAGGDDDDLPPLLELAADPFAAVPADVFLAAWAAALPREYVTHVEPAPAPPPPPAAGTTTFALVLPPPSPPPPPSSDDGSSSRSMGGGALSIHLLAGAALADVTPTGGVTLRPLPPAALSPDPATRFRQLFSVRPRWTIDGLTPYVAPLVGFGRTRDDLVLAHTRATRVSDKLTLFSAR